MGPTIARRLRKKLDQHQATSSVQRSLICNIRRRRTTDRCGTDRARNRAISGCRSSVTVPVRREHLAVLAPRFPCNILDILAHREKFRHLSGRRLEARLPGSRRLGLPSPRDRSHSQSHVAFLFKTTSGILSKEDTAITPRAASRRA